MTRIPSIGLGRRHDHPADVAQHSGNRQAGHTAGRLDADYPAQDDENARVDAGPFQLAQAFAWDLTMDRLRFVGGLLFGQLGQFGLIGLPARAPAGMPTPDPADKRLGLLLRVKAHRAGRAA